MTSKDKNNNETSEIRCSFCGRSEDEVDSLVGRDGVYVCEDCCDALADTFQNRHILNGDFNKDDTDNSVQNFQEYLSMLHDVANGVSEGQTPFSYGQYFDYEDDDEGLEKQYQDLENLPTPQAIYSCLCDHVIGQDDAKKKLAISVYNHYKRILMSFRENPNEPDHIEIAKSNVLLLGPTGSGKTLLAQTLARYMRVPFAIADATSLTEAGYVGDDVENILRKLLIAADWDVARAELGIIYIDEIDKIARKGDSASITRDVSGEGVQQALLKIIEGTEASIPPQGGRKHPTQEVVEINTKDILFILGGAFVGLDKVIERRTGKRGLGFATSLPEDKKKQSADLLKNCIPEDLQSYGLIPEFVGRISVITSLDELTEDDLVSILTKPKHALIKQYKKMFEFEDCELTFEKGAYQEIAKIALEQKTGARGLRSILEGILSDVMFEIPEYEEPTKIVVKVSDVRGDTNPTIEATGKHSNKSDQVKQQNKAS